jgi:hypothetical protein
MQVSNSRFDTQIYNVDVLDDPAGMNRLIEAMNAFAQS